MHDGFFQIVPAAVAVHEEFTDRIGVLLMLAARFDSDFLQNAKANVTECLRGLNRMHDGVRDACAKIIGAARHVHERLRRHAGERIRLRLLASLFGCFAWQNKKIIGIVLLAPVSGPLAGIDKFLLRFVVRPVGWQRKELAGIVLTSRDARLSRIVGGPRRDLIVQRADSGNRRVALCPPSRRIITQRIQVIACEAKSSCFSQSSLSGVVIHSGGSVRLHVIQ